MSGDPPSFNGACQDTCTAVEVEANTVTFRGALGFVEGNSTTVAVLPGIAVAFAVVIATTCTSYDTEFVSPVMMDSSSNCEVSASVHVVHVDDRASRYDTSYFVNVPPPSCAFVNGIQETVSAASWGTAIRACTAFAAVAGVSAVDGLDAGPVPAEFIADTVTVYAVPFVSPDTVQASGEAEGEHAVVETAVPPPTGVAVTW